MTPTGIAGWFGIAVLLVGLSIGLLQVWKGAKGGIPLSLIALLVGVVLIQAHRLEEVLLGDVGQIKFAKEQVLEDANEVALLRDRIEELAKQAEDSIHHMQSNLSSRQISPIRERSPMLRRWVTTG